MSFNATMISVYIDSTTCLWRGWKIKACWPSVPTIHTCRCRQVLNALLTRKVIVYAIQRCVAPAGNESKFWKETSRPPEFALLLVQSWVPGWSTFDEEWRGVLIRIDWSIEKWGCNYICMSVGLIYGIVGFRQVKMINTLARMSVGQYPLKVSVKRVVHLLQFYFS